jgi:signal transduction histidine kinase/ligand-binding sensor domain-containing protein
MLLGLELHPTTPLSNTATSLSWVAAFTSINRIRRALVGACLWLCVLLVGPAQAQYSFNSWTADDGLPQNSINDILQTRDGYLWITTFDGLVRFDGIRFMIFNKANSPGLANNRLLTVYEHSKGDLWLATEDGFLVRRHLGSFTSYGRKDGLPGTPIRSLYEDVDGTLLLSFDSGPTLGWTDGKILPVSSPATSVDLKAAYRKNSGVYCSTANSTLWCLLPGSRKEWTLNLDPSSLKMVPGSAIDQNGTLWLPVANVGLVRIDEGQEPRVYNETNGLPGKPVVLTPGPRLLLVSRDPQDVYWLTDVQSMKSELIGKDVPPALTNGYLKGLTDNEGNIWFGTSRYGLLRARHQSFVSYSTREGLETNNVYPIFEDRSGDVWIGTVEGLFRYHNGVFTMDRDLGTRTITAIGEDSSGRVAIGSFEEVWIRDGDRFNLKLHLPAFVWAIHPEPDGSLWIGTEKGLNHVNDGSTTIYTTKNGLAADDVKVIIGDGRAGLWIGSYGGLTHYKDGQFKEWTERDGLPTGTIRSLYQDQEQVLWIGTYDGGLIRFKDGHFTSITVANGLFDNGVFQILADRRDNFWMSSNRGIYRVRHSELNEFAEGKLNSITSVSYGKTDGILNVECNGGRSPAGAATRDGRLWFPTQDGVAVIDPQAVSINTQPPPVLIESFLIDRKEVEFKDEVRIQPDQENFEIQFTALSFIDSGNVRFKYKLEGLDHDWIDAGKRRQVYFSHVPPGSYTFRVIAANSDGIWNTEGAVVRVYVQPRFYRTWWFLSLVALCVIGLVVAVHRVRVTQLERARREQEEFSRKLLASQEQERQRIAAELHDSLGQSLLIIKNRIALAQSDITERETVEEQLDELSNSATSAIEECREIAYNLRPYQIGRFGLSKTLYGIFMRLNEVTEISATAEIEPIDDVLAGEVQTSIYRIVQECVNNIIKHSGATHASLLVTRADDAITLLITDNGRGFIHGPEPQPKEARSGFGLLGIAERVRMLGGTLQIHSENGTGVRIQIPLAKA